MEFKPTHNPDQTSGESGRYNLWVGDEWFIPVNELGICEGVCFEGALGFVVQLLHADREHNRLALKIPKLMGETHRENAYISDLMEKELEAVQDIFNKADSNTEGLLKAETWARGGPIRGEIETSKGSPEAIKWNGGIVLVHFEKGRRPRFCLVKKAKGTRHSGKDSGVTDIVVFPPGVEDCPVKSTEMYDKLEAFAFNSGNVRGSERRWDRTVFIDLGKDSGSEPTVMSKEDALRDSPTGQTWYTCVPSIPYSWAPGTLQEAISLKKRGEKWGIREHFSLAKRICMGIYALHRNRMLHADLRPANIVYRGEPSRPDNYYVSDYGSFAEMGRVRDPGHSPTGDTVLGPVAGTERASPFYAPERRAGLEREAADTAIIRGNPGGATLDIVLGWRSDLGEDIRSTVQRAKRPKNSALTGEGAGLKSGSLSGSSLLKGDRIQIRDYIFDIVSAAEVDGNQVLECNSRSWKIFQGRIVVENTESFAQEQRLPIPRTVELQQWSAATDLYSLGALFLYSVYRSEKPAPEENSAATEEKFREMLGYLEGEPYFNTIWTELESLRAQLEQTLTEDKISSAEQFAKLPFRKQSNGGDEDNTTLKQETIKVVTRITQTVPWSRRLVEVFDFNLGPFIFFIHFVLCCLHRRSHLKEESGDEAAALRGSNNRELPFCENRIEAPAPDGAASRALARLRAIRPFISDKRLSDLKTEESDIPGFDPRPDPLIRAAYYFLSQKAQEVADQGPKGIDEAGALIKLLMSVSGPSISTLKKPFIDLQDAIKRSQKNELSTKDDTGRSTENDTGKTPEAQPTE
jgi:hypothetical protein